MKKLIKRVPLVGPVAKRIYRALFYRPKPFPGSEEYWVQRYSSGGNSGLGSYNDLAIFKAEIINDFVRDNNVTTVIEYGCGDGSQLRLATYPGYIGFDVSPKAIKLCQKMFQDDATKSFELMAEYKGETAQLTLSLDVIYHLIEDDIYFSYMKRLFSSSEQFVIIYSSDFDADQKNHERRRQFTTWVRANEPQWKLINHIPNRFPYTGSSETGSLADFYMYEKSV